jgi:hypothetical protein
MKNHPYSKLPDQAYWKRSIAGFNPADVDPVVDAKFIISKGDRIATSGSCFAQHLSRRLSNIGFNYFVTETVHPSVSEFSEKYNYATYTTRSGNIYTPRQLKQLLLRAYGHFSPQENFWECTNGYFKDPFRPEIQPCGFRTISELIADRSQHFAAVREMAEKLGVFVFTLGLTEAWVDRRDGAVYPVCPGVTGGEFDPMKYNFVNMNVAEVLDDLRFSLNFIRSVNPWAKFIITVSPVPLVATFEPRSVLVSTTYSKSVLRVAAEEVSATDTKVAYFPSYEIITGNFSRGRYFGDDLRAVTEEGVDHVMRLFLKHYTNSTSTTTENRGDSSFVDMSVDNHMKAMRRVVAVMCEEEKLDS